nr:multiple epidermal growth factor-like domains protein 10 [Crassostrea gigas]
MKYQLYVVLCLYCSITLCASLNCERNSDENCLEDCQWNKTLNKCVDCNVGSYGENCSSRCRYPNYGRNCQHDCSYCNQELCDSTLGCPKNYGTTQRGSKASKEISFGSVQLDYVIIGIMASGFLVTFIAIAFLFRRKKQWVRNIRTSSFVDRLSYR